MTRTVYFSRSSSSLKYTVRVRKPETALFLFLTYTVYFSHSSSRVVSGEALYTQPRSPRLNLTLGVNCGIVELWNYLLHCPWPHPPPRPSQENNVEVGKLWEFRGGHCNKYFHNSTVYTGGKRHTNVTLQGSGRRREMQHGSVGFRPPCGQKRSVPRCNCSVGFLPHCHAAFLGGGGTRTGNAAWQCGVLATLQLQRGTL